VQAFGPEVLLAGEKQDTSVGQNSDGNNDENKLATIDRAKLGSIVFANRSKMQQLERIVWPHVKDKIQQQIQEIDEQYGKELEKEEEEQASTKNINAENGDEREKKPDRRRAIVIVEAAVLLDAGWDDMFNPNHVGNGGGAGVWVVRASNHVARQRLIEQRGYTEPVADKRIQAQHEESRRGIGAENLQLELDRGTVTQVIANDGDLDDLRTALAHALSSIPTSSSS
jgi:dephospho-CoA kinase